MTRLILGGSIFDLGHTPLYYFEIQMILIDIFLTGLILGGSIFDLLIISWNPHKILLYFHTNWLVHVGLSIDFIYSCVTY